MLHILTLSLGLAHAGWFSNLCSRLIVDDPYQWEGVSREYIEREVDRLSIRREWQVATAHELVILGLMESELASRERIRAVIDAAR